MPRCLQVAPECCHRWDNHQRLSKCCHRSEELAQTVSVVSLVSHPWLEPANDGYTGKMVLLKAGTSPSGPQGLKCLVRMSWEEGLGDTAGHWDWCHGRHTRELAAGHHIPFI